jgi:DNA-binding NarL/FixJ family response regulator
MMTRVLIATNEPVLAKGLESILLASELHVAAICHDIFELFEGLQRHPPDIAIIDLPVLPGPEVFRELRHFAPKTQFVLWPRKLPEQQVNDAVRCGARGILSANTTPSGFVDAMNLIAQFGGADPPPAALVNASCSPAEREFISLLGHGLTNEEIAAAMRSDAATVNRFLKDLSHRLGAEDRYELALYGLSVNTEPRP